MQRTMQDYATLVFDCDGVVLNSNRIKTEAFYETALPYGEDAAQRLVDFHVNNGGISRYKKFALFLEDMTDRREGPSLKQLLQNYAALVHEGLMTCEITPGLDALRNATVNARWLIVSGGDQEELREVFAARGIDKHFDGGILGSPDTKDEILAREASAENLPTPALFLGDSTYDHRAATTAGLDFIFVSGWTEISGWEDWTREKGIVSIHSIQDAMRGDSEH
ncbi:HAD family hydrolase [Garicola koreensis]|uniref:Phosphoglycolate phosphatase-like HAD superfamily hydrolase n=1 Tax=Garicola koreensis TaxID=1262554 RepID=A0A7W5TTQ8_9MICC|nr:HAD family hydrolase [Garicola koreensis]MBB3667608.1 phosphoglycolate phosphatase-like HAD superfamily hydrolase [Garicola koreensis]